MYVDRTTPIGQQQIRMRPFKTWGEAYSFGRFKTTNGYETEQSAPFRIYKSNGMWCVSFDGCRWEYTPPPPPPPPIYAYTYRVTVRHSPGIEPEWPDWIEEPEQIQDHYCCGDC